MKRRIDSGIKTWTLWSLVALVLFPLPATTANGAPMFESELIDIGSPTESMAAGDINGDGLIDLVAAPAQPNQFSTPHILLMFADPNAQQGYVSVQFELEFEQRLVKLVDVDLDNDLDLIVAGHSNGDPDNHEVQVFFNDAFGNFTIEQTFDFTNPPQFVELKDVNYDNWPDMVLLFGSAVGVSLNQGDGHFGPTTLETGSTSFMSWMEVADINGDGLQDVVFADFGDQRVLYVSIALDGLSLSPISSIEVGVVDIRGMTTVDVNGDGVYEIPVIIDGPLQNQSTLRIVTHPINTAFLPQPDFTVNEYLNQISAANINNDGKIDLVADGEFSNFYFPGAAIGFDPPIPATASALFTRFITTDLNGDLHTDLVCFRHFGTNSAIMIAYGCGDGGFSSRPPQYVFETTAFAYGDVDGEGVPDFITTDAQSLKIHLAVDGEYQTPVPLDVDGHRIAHVTDMDLDGIPDIVTTGSAGAISIHYGQGGMQFTTVVLPADLSVSLFDAESVDVDDDGILDIVVASRTNIVAIRRGLGNRTFGPSELLDLTFLPPNTTLTGIGVGEGTGDGLVDIFVTTQNQFSDRSVLVMAENDGAGQFHDIFQHLCGGPLTSLLVEDLDQDDLIDIAVGAGLDDSLTVLWSEPGEGLRGPQYLPTPPDSMAEPEWMCAGDLNQDGHVDIVIALESSTLDVWMNDGRGRFKQTESFIFAQQYWRTQTMQLVDVTGDDIIDVVIGFGDGDIVTVAEGAGDGTIASIIELPLPQNNTRHSLTANWDDDPEDEVFLIDGGDLLLVDFDQTLMTPVIRSLDALRAALLPYGPIEYNATVAIDANGDGLMDLTFLPNTTSTPMVTVLHDGAGLSEHLIIESPGAPLRLRTIVAGDLNQDGAADILGFNIDTSTDGPDTMYPLFGDNSGAFVGSLEHATALGNVIPPTMHDSKLADMNGDGHLDLISIMRERNIGVWNGRGNGAFEPGHFFETALPKELIVDIADFNSDGRLDVAPIVRSSNVRIGVEVHFGTSGDQFGVLFDGAFGDYPSGIGVVDTKPSGPPSLAVSLRNEARVAIVELNKDRTFGVRRESAVGREPAFVATGDIDQDGDRDLTIGMTGAVVGHGVLDELFTLIKNHRDGSLPGDLDMTGLVDGGDLAILLAQWGSDGPADFNNDGFVNGDDLAQLLSVWGAKSNASTPCD